MDYEGFFYFEPFTDDFSRHFKVEKIYYQGKTEFQRVQIFGCKVFGRVLFLDGKIQSAEIDEFVFHEALVHPALISHPSPTKVLVIGGGEGATIREVLRHDGVEKAVMVDIDRKLVELCQEYLPPWSAGSFSNSKTRLLFGDAKEYLAGVNEEFDVIVSDLTEPVREGPSVYLFTREFFSRVDAALNEDGIFVLQAGSTDPYYNNFFASCAKTLGEIFPLVRPYWTFVFSFGMPWGFIVASKKEDPVALDEQEISRRIEKRGIEGLRFYHPGLHRSLFSLPLYLLQDLKKGRILTDKEPFIWEV
ncbi:MAG: polyamine aminopropyltransferase [Candidatus Aminicenantales bacterium]